MYTKLPCMWREKETAYSYKHMGIFLPGYAVNRVFAQIFTKQLKRNEGHTIH